MLRIVTTYYFTVRSLPSIPWSWVAANLHVDLHITRDLYLMTQSTLMMYQWSAPHPNADIRNLSPQWDIISNHPIQRISSNSKSTLKHNLCLQIPCFLSVKETIKVSVAVESMIKNAYYPYKTTSSQCIPMTPLNPGEFTESPHVIWNHSKSMHPFWRIPTLKR